MKTANHQFIRDVNTSIILENILQNKPVSRIQIAKNTKLNKSTVTRIINNLIEKELVVELGNASKNDAGRKPILLSNNKDAGCAIGIEIDHHEIYGILTNLNGEIIQEIKENLHTKDQNEITKQLVNIIKILNKSLPPTPYGLVGIGIGVHGMVNEVGVIQFAPYLEWHAFDLKKRLENHLHTEIIINNEANFSAIGEHIFQKNDQNMIILNIKSGIGMGIILNHKLYNGKSGYAGEVGHMIIEPNGKPCPCGNKGCFEQYASEDAFIKESGYTRNELVHLLKQDKIPTHKLLDYLALGVNNILSVFNPETIIINSQLYKHIPYFINKLNERLRSNMNVDYDIIFSTLEEKACVLGAASSVIKQFYDIKYLVYN